MNTIYDKERKVQASKFKTVGLFEINYCIHE